MVRQDDLQCSGLRILQDPERFCFGMDAVLLAGFAGVRKGETALDLGTGTGIIPLLLAAKTEGRLFHGLELQAESAAMAADSVRLNEARLLEMGKEIRILQGDLKDAAALYGRSSMDVVTCNPPYMKGAHGITNPADAKAIARHEISCTFEDVARETAAVLKSGGRFFLVHRPFRIPELFQTMQAYHLEPKRMRLAYPYVDREPNMVLVEAVKGGNPRMTVEKPLIIWEAQGIYSEEMRRDYGY